MNSMDTVATTTPARQAVVTSLAVVGFVALVVVGMSLAIYSTRFVPTVADRVGSAAVYLGSIFNPTPTPTLSVVPTASTSISFGTPVPASSTVAATSPVATNVAPTPVATPAPQPTPVTPTNTGGVYQIAGAPATALYGLPDLTVSIDTIGYLETASTDSFVASSSVPHGSRPAIKFTIKNIGSNWTGTWRFSASIPTRTSSHFESDPQQSLAPGESIDYILGFDRASTGSGQVISITANFDRAVADSNTSNDSASASLTVL